MLRLRAIARRLGTALAALGLAIGATSLLITPSMAFVTAVGVITIAAVLIVHHDQLIRRLYGLAVEQRSSLVRLDRLAESIDELDRLLATSRGTQEAHLGELAQQLVANGRTLVDRMDLLDQQLAANEPEALRRILVDRMDVLDQKLSSSTENVRKGFDAANRDRDSLYRQVEALNNLSSLVAGEVGLPPLRDWALSPDSALFLSRLIMANKPQLVVELGSGSSTALVSRLLANLGTGAVVSVEHDEEYASASRSLVDATGDPSVTTIVLCPLIEVSVDGDRQRWYDMSSVSFDRPIDILIVDGPPSDTGPLARRPAELLFDHVREGGLIMLDDAKRADETQTVQRWSGRPDIRVEPTPNTEKGLALLRKVTGSGSISP
jgi:predicted O-methyltransferase YrrM